jgi:hypothetical protein
LVQESWEQVFQLVQLVHLSTYGGSGGELESWTKVGKKVD